MAFRFSRTYRSLLRLKDIASVLTRHGLGQLVDVLNLRAHVPFLSRLQSLTPLRGVPITENLGERLVEVMKELGPTFIKLGQMLSGRPDIIPELWLSHFRSLQDKVPPFDVALARQIVEAELGVSVEEAFASFSEQPIASGSMAQAHPAVLKDGTEVIVKVRRPDIDRQILTDIELLHNLAVLTERYVDELRIVRPVMIVDEFARGLRKELDFITEATYTSKFENQINQLTGIRCPRVYWDLTTTTVLTIEKLPGRNIGDFERLEALGLDRSELAHTLSSAFMTQYFETGLFHADPHPGNILVDETGEIGLIDFGSVGHLSPTLKGQLASVVLALLRNDLELIVQIYTDIGAFSEATDIDDAKSDLLELLDKYFGVPLNKVEATDVFVDLLRAARKNKVVMPREFVMLGKSLVMVATLCRDLDPQFNLAAAARPHLWPILREKLSPLRLLNRGMLQAWNLVSLIERLPGDAKQLLRQARAGELRTITRHEGLEPISRSVDRASARLSVALVVAALLIGASLIWVNQTEISYLASLGYVMATVLGLWMMLDIARPRR